MKRCEALALQEGGVGDTRGLWANATGGCSDAGRTHNSGKCSREQLAWIVMPAAVK
jgi:hypothetical protein